MDVRDYIALLRRSWLMIVACTVIAAAIGTAVALLTPPMYQATTQLYVSVRNTGAASDLAQSANYARLAVASYVQVVPTSLVLEPVIDEFQLDLTESELAEQVSASSSLNTQLISITVTDPNPSLTAQLANAIGASLAAVVPAELEPPAVAGEASKVRVETVAPALVPTSPSSPNLPLSVTLGALLGLALGVGLAVLRAVLDTRVHTVADVEETLETPILGGIPFDPASARRPLVVQDVPRGPHAEAFRAARTNLQFLTTAGQTPTFVVTSSAPAEGKSTTCVNLALVLAETGARVALVDADLRKPRVADLLGIEGGAGLSDVLAGRLPLSDAVRRWGDAGLFVVPAGTVPPNPAELLGSPAMQHVLDELRAVFDVILIDAPPLLAVTDAAVVTRLTTGAIMIAASGSSRKPSLENAAKVLASADARLLGAVMTKLPTSGPDSLAYGAYTYGVTHSSAR